MLSRLWNYVKGYVIIIVEGYFLEKFVNICTRRRIFLWNIKKQKNSAISLNVGIGGFKRLRPVAKKAGCRVRIIKKHGVPFVLYRYKKRKTFIAGAVLFAALFYFMSSFIWSVEVVGNKRLDAGAIMDMAYQLGVKPGVHKSSIDTHEVASTLVLDIDGLAWASVIVRGTKVKIEIAEAIEKPQIVEKDVACDIVAAKDGVIKAISVKAGIEAVAVGETVQKGQVLISGAVPVKNEDIPIVLHAMGEVSARTWYDAIEPVQTTIFERIRTNDKKDNVSLMLFSKKIDLFHTKPSFAEYDTVSIEKALCIGEDFVLPFGVVIERNYENNITERKLSVDEGKTVAANSAYKKVLESIPDGAKVVDSSVAFIEQEGQIFAEVIIECLENIGFEREIGGS